MGVCFTIKYVQFNFLDVAAEQRMRGTEGRVVGVETIVAMGWLICLVVAKLTHTHF
jgi:hypothetical protein